MESVLCRRLESLGYPNSTKFNADDRREFSCCVLWLEDQRIRHYDDGERDRRLRDGSGSDADQWEAGSLAKYLAELGCPGKIASSGRRERLTWLVGQAVKLKFLKNPARYNNSEPGQRRRQKALGDCDVSSPEFRSKVEDLAGKLAVPLHPDPSVTFEACCTLIRERAAKSDTDVAAKAKGQTVTLSEHSMGVPPELRSSDPALCDALKILRLLHLKDLRGLQDEINNTIETVQAVTANPKTDTRLGKVGR